MDPQVIALGATLVEDDAPGKPGGIFAAEQIVADQPERCDVSTIAEPHQHIGDPFLGGGIDRRVAGQIQPIESDAVRVTQSGGAFPVDTAVLLHNFITMPDTRADWSESAEIFIVSCNYARRQIAPSDYDALVADPDWSTVQLP